MKSRIHSPLNNLMVAQPNEKKSPAFYRIRRFSTELERNPWSLRAVQHFVTSYTFTVKGCLPPLNPSTWRIAQFSVVRDCLFNTSAAFVHPQRPPPSSAAQGRPMLSQ